MKIGLVGYFGWGNYGDELFLEILRHEFRKHDTILFHNAESGVLEPDFEERLESVDAVIIGGGDLLIPWYKSWLFWDARYLSKPVFVFGIGVPTWGGISHQIVEHYRNFLLHPNVRWVSCRDIESKLWIEEHISSELPVSCYPDMVLAYPFPQQKADSRTLGLVLRKQPSYEYQYLRTVEQVAAEHGLKTKIIMLATGKTLQDDIESIQDIRFRNYDLVVRDSLGRLNEEISSCSFLLSMKFHGIVAAYKAGVPHIALSQADKFSSFLKQAGNAACSSSMEDDQLPDKFEKLLYDSCDFSHRLDLTRAAREGVGTLVHLVEEL